MSPLYFKVLGKVIKICKNGEYINLFRKTAFNILSAEKLEEVMQNFRKINSLELNLPELRYKIEGPAAIIIPIAIYA